MRHGFAGESFKDDPKKDDARALMPDGRDAAKAVAKHLADEGMSPTIVLAGPATRTVQTGRIAADVFGCDFAVEPMLYVGGPMTVLLRRLADSGAKRVHLVTHDDVIENTLHKLDGQDPKQPIDKVAMAEARVVDFDRGDLSWEERMRVLPSDLGLDDHYDHRGVIVSDGKPPA